MQGRFLLCLGELHGVFAHARAIGNFIDSSGISDGWLEAKWFDSEAVVLQIKDCKHMKRAIEAHEATFVAIQILMIREMMKTDPEYFITQFDDLYKLMKAVKSPVSENSDTFREIYSKLEEHLFNNKFNEKYQNYG